MVTDTYQPYYLPVTHKPRSWNQGSEIYVVNGSIQRQSDMNLVAQGNEAFTSQNHHSNTRELINNDNYLLGDPQNYQLESSLHTSQGFDRCKFQQQQLDGHRNELPNQ